MSMMNKGSEVSVGIVIKHDALLKHEFFFKKKYKNWADALNKEIAAGKEEADENFQISNTFLGMVAYHFQLYFLD